MLRKAVIGLQFGDEGKGRVVSQLCRNAAELGQFPYVIRYSGGGQAGHRVVHDGKEHIFSNFGSGTFSGATTVWTRNCPFSPAAFLTERSVLSCKGVKPHVVIDPECPVVLPGDVARSIQVARATGNGSVGVGIGAALEREEQHYSLRVKDCFYLPVFEARLQSVTAYYAELGIFNDPVESHALRNIVVSLYKDKFVDFIKIPDLGYPSKTVHVYESSQGVLLDKDKGFFPHVTRSSVGYGAIGEKMDKVIYVTRAYQTRHGPGFMTNENIPHNIRNPQDDIYRDCDNSYRGEFRTALLDLDLLLYALRADRPPEGVEVELAVTCTDQIRDDLRMTHAGEVKTFGTLNEFLSYIQTFTGLPVMYTDSPDTAAGLITFKG